jgi:hypothetical protein
MIQSTRLLNSNFPLLCGRTSPGQLAQVVCSNVTAVGVGGLCYMYINKTVFP